VEGGGFVREAVQHGTSDEAGNVEEDDDNNTFSLTPSSGQEDSDEDGGDGHDHGGGDAEEDGLVGIVSEALDDETGEVGLEGVGHVVPEDSEDEHPNPVIGEGLDDLRFLVVVVLDTGLVALETFDGDDTFAFVQPGTGHGRIGQEEPKGNAEDDGEETEEQEHPLVWEPTVDVHVRNTEEDETSGTADETIGTIPQTDTSSLFLALPPRGGNQDETGIDAGFKDAEEEAGGGECRPSGSRSAGGEDDTPQSKVDGEVFSSGETLHEPIGRVLSKEIANVEQADQQAEFLTGEMRLTDDAVGGSLGDGLTGQIWN
jgi:hypothetical protein